MTPEELRAHVRTIRADRRIVKERPAVKVKKREASIRTKAQALEVMDIMSEEQLALLIRELEKDADGQGDTTKADQGEGQSKD
jgi:hypothetical protein